MLPEFLAQGFSGFDEGVKLGEERNSPHEIAAYDGEDEGRAP